MSAAAPAAAVPPRASSSRPRTVLLEAEKLRVPYSGLGQFCLHLGRALVAAAAAPPGGPRISFHLPRERIGMFGPGAGYLPWSRVHKLAFPAARRFDVFHALHQGTPYAPRGGGRLVLTIHDLNFLEKYRGGRRARVHLRALQRLVDRAAAIAFISRFTESVARRHLDIRAPGAVIYNGVALDPAIGPARPACAPDRPFFLALGIVQPKKNFHVLLPVLERFRAHALVIAGDARDPYAAGIAATARRTGVGDRLVLTGPVGEAEKRWLYERCEALLFPSLTEGFGLPALEALSVGRPVVLSRLTSLPEVGGDLATYWEHFEPAHVVAQVERALERAAADPALPARSRAHAAAFSWDAAARAYLRLYAEAAAS